MVAKKHHYIPKCYLKAWAGADKNLCEYRKVDRRIVISRKHPSQTGWTDSLYSVATLPPESVDHVEDVWFARVDQDASNALDLYTQGKTLVGEKMVSGWSRFIMSLMQRHPGKIDGMWRKCEAELARQYGLNAGDDPESVEKRAYFDAHRTRLVGDLFATAIMQACNLPNVGQHINKMRQRVVTLGNGHGRFLTSDNPLFLSGGLARPGNFFLLPISPRHLWIATNTDEVANKLIQKLDVGDLLAFVNYRVVTQAYSYIYGICENQRKFVERWASHDPPETYEHLKVTDADVAGS
jgi:hypothetical protein